MKQLLLAILLLACSDLYAQTGDSHSVIGNRGIGHIPGDTFWGMPFGITKDSVLSLLQNIKDVKYNVTDSNITCQGATFAELKTDILCLTFMHNQFCCAKVVFEEQGVSTCQSFFQDIWRQLRAKYGKPEAYSDDFRRLNLIWIGPSGPVTTGGTKIFAYWTLPDADAASEINYIITGINYHCATYIACFTKNMITQMGADKFSKTIMDY